jgi:hypothetical protein
MLNEVDMLPPEPLLDGKPNVQHMTFGGQLVFRWGWDGLHILHADPQVCFTAELIKGVIRAGPDAEVSLVPSAAPEQPFLPREVCGRLLRIEALNCTVIYRLVAYEHGPRWYRAEWPD